jgi:hypothetical protein
MLRAVGRANIVFCAEGVVAVTIGFPLGVDIGIVCWMACGWMFVGERLGFWVVELRAGIGGEVVGVRAGGADAGGGEAGHGE